MTGPGLSFERAGKRYRSRSEVVTAVDRISLAVEPGEVVALCGPSGSGKTTLLLLAAALLAPDSGSVRFGGTDLASLGARELADYRRRDVGLIPQTIDLFPGVPALENAAIKLLADRVPLRRARRAARPWLERVGLGERLDHAPAELSGGERARVAIARALVNGPRLVLADEPTANLDSRRGLDIVGLLAEIGRERGVAVLIVTHDLQAAELADRVETLRDGRLAPTARPSGRLEV